jgi:hypothetical protein
MRLNELTMQWDSLPERKRNKLEIRLQRWAEMSPEEKKVVKERRKKFQSLPLEERIKIKQKYQWYKQLSPQEQEELRQRWQKQSNNSRQ